jgi:hypothetical protein
VLGDRVEVAVGVHEGRLQAPGDGGDDAVGHRPDRLALAAQGQEQRARLTEVTEGIDLEERHRVGDPLDPPEILGVAGTRQELHDDRLGDARGRSFATHHPADLQVGFAPGSAEVLDPRGGVNEIHLR